MEYFYQLSNSVGKVPSLMTWVLISGTHSKSQSYCTGLQSQDYLEGHRPACLEHITKWQKQERHRFRIKWTVRTNSKKLAPHRHRGMQTPVLTETPASPPHVLAETDFFNSSCVGLQCDIRASSPNIFKCVMKKDSSKEVKIHTKHSYIYIH